MSIKRLLHFLRLSRKCSSVATRQAARKRWLLGIMRTARTPTHGYEPTREAAVAAFATSWRREDC